MAPTWRRQYQRYRELFLNIVVLYKKKPEVLLFLELLLSIITVTFMSLVALRPTLIAISTLVKDIDSQEETLDKMDQKISNLAAARQVYQQETSRILLLKSAIPQSPEPENWVRQIEGLSAKHSVNLISNNISEVVLVGQDGPADREEGDTFPIEAQPMEVSTSLSGNYPALFSFISDLEKFRRPVKIDSLVLSAQDSEGVRILNLNFSARTPFVRGTESVNN